MKKINGIQIVSMEKQLAQVRLRAPFSAAEIYASEDLQKRLKDLGLASQWSFVPAQQKQDNFNFQKVGDVLPRDEDYILVPFRALSKTIVEGHWIDWSKDDVLKSSTPLLLGATVYPNHDFTDINNWIGSVASVEWDEDGAQSDGVPGINVKYKIDALMNPRIARGLLMRPPAIHSTSMTVLFKFEYSHPDIATESRYRFFDLLGEEVEGHIVRLIVTEIIEYWEASLVFQGADRLAKQCDEDDEDFTDLSAAADDNPTAQADTPPANSNEEKTMKLTKEKKEELGIEFDGDDVPETEIFKAAESHAATVKAFGSVKPTEVAELRTRAEAGDKFVTLQRGEVTRLAKLSELGADEGDLPAVVAKQIKDADFDTLVELQDYFGKKVAEKFPETSRSSEEEAAAVENAGGVTHQKTTVPKVGLL